MSYAHEPPVVVWCLFFLVIIVITFIFGAIMQGIWGIKKDGVKQRKRRRLEYRRYNRSKKNLTKNISVQAKALEQYDLFEDYEEFDRMMRKPACEYRRYKERFEVKVTQVYCGNDLSWGERVLRTKRAYYEYVPPLKPYQQPFPRSRYERLSYHERNPGLFVDCQI